MARRRRTLSQYVVRVLTPGVPKTVKRIAASRSCAPVILLGLIILGATGIVTLKWSGVFPRLSINRQRAGEVAETLSKSQGAAEIARLADNVRKRLPVQTQGRPGSGVSAVPPTTAVASNRPFTAVGQSGETFRIASFNIQVFGTSKASKPRVMDILAKVVRQFDIVAIQELRTKDATVMESFIRLINSNGVGYEYVIGPRLGRTTSKEQYVFVFDSQRIEVAPSSVVTLQDSYDLLHREPLIARFRTRWRGTAPPFTFILVNIHTDPDETDTELDALGEAFVAVQQNPWGEDDVVLLGDLNVDYTKLGALGRLTDIRSTVHGQPTNTRGNKSYDNIVFNQVATTEFTGNAAVLDLQQAFGLTLEQALEVSDHSPVWAEFTMVEGGTRALLASRNPPSQPAVRGASATLPNSSYPSRDAYQRQ